MLRRRSRAFILASAIRRARALSCDTLHRSPDSMSGRKMAAKMDTKMAAKMAVMFMPTVYTFQARTGHPRAAHKYNQRGFRTLFGFLTASPFEKHNARGYADI